LKPVVVEGNVRRAPPLYASGVTGSVSHHLRRWSARYPDHHRRLAPDLIILDEAQRIKNGRR